MINISNQFNQDGFDSLNVWIYFKDNENALFTSTDSLKLYNKKHILKMIHNAWSKGESYVAMYRLGIDEIQFG